MHLFGWRADALVRFDDLLGEDVDLAEISIFRVVCSTRLSYLATVRSASAKAACGGGPKEKVLPAGDKERRRRR